MAVEAKGLKVLVASRQASDYGQMIEERFPGVKVIAAEILNETAEGCVQGDVEDVDVIVAAAALPYTMPRIRNLRWFQALSAGYEHILRTGLITREVIFTSAAGVAAIPVSETVVGFMLSLVKKFPQMWERQKEKRLVRRVGETGEIYGKRLGILGLGNIGGTVAKKAKLGFEMEILGYDVSLPADALVDAFYSPGQLKELLAHSDFVVIALPLTRETHGLMGEDELRGMKKTAYLINVARGEIVVKEALILALKEGWIAGAALDVYWGDPTTNLLAPEDELWQFDNVIMTPHNAATSDRYLPRAFDLFCTNLERFIKGDELINVVKER